MLPLGEWAYQQFTFCGMHQYIGGRLGYGYSDIASAIFVETQCLRYLDGSSPGIPDGTLILYDDRSMDVAQISRLPANDRDSRPLSRLALDLKITYQALAAA